jgi:hypothetical protein
MNSRNAPVVDPRRSPANTARLNASVLVATAPGHEMYQLGGWLM